MSYSVNALFTRALKEQDARYLFAFPPALFNDTEKVWIKFVQDYLSSYKTLPVLERFQQEFPAFRVEDIHPGIPTKDIFDQVLPEAQQQYLAGRVQQDFLKEKVWTPQYLENLIQDTKPRSTELLKLTDLTAQDLLRPRKMYSWGASAKWMEALVGKLDHKDFVVIAGKAKSAKTTILSLIATSLFKEGYNIMLFNNELDKDFMARKIIAILQKFNPNVFRNEEVPEDVRQKFVSFEEEMKKHENQIYIYGRIKSPTDIITAYRECEKTPDIMIIDAFNNVGTKNANNQSEQSISLGNYAQFIRDFVNDFGIPAIITCQLNRTSGDSNTPTQDTIGGSIEIIRQADHVLTTVNYEDDPTKLASTSPIAQRFKDKYPNTKMPFFYVNTMVSRHGGTGAKVIHIDWSTMNLLIADPSLVVREDLTDPKIMEEVLYERNVGEAAYERDVEEVL